MQKDEKERNPYWDNIKGLLIFLVVLGHFLWDFRNQGFARYIVEIIYLFHMPAFIFVAGYFSKSNRSKSRISILKLVVIYFIFNSALMLFGYIFEEESLFLVTPYYSSWFLISLIVWRLTIKFLDKLSHLFLISLLVSILVGFWSDVSNILAISRTIAFFPFFVIGYKFPKDMAKKFIYDRKAKEFFIGVLLLILTILLSGVFIYKYPELCDLNLLMVGYASWFDVISRITIFTISGLMIMSILFLMPKKRLLFLTKWGRNSLSIYVLHRFIALLFSNIFLPINYDNYYIALAFLASILTVIILGSDFVSKKFHLVINSILNYFITIYDDKQIKIKTIKYNYLLIILLIVFLSLPVINIFFSPSELMNIDNQAEDIIHQVLATEQSQDLENAVSLAFVGDLILLEDQVKRAYSDSRDEYDFRSMFEFATNYLREADLAIGVFEGPTAGKEAGYSTGNYDDGLPLYLNYPDSFAEAVKYAGIDLVTTANNHLLDKGIEGAMRTLGILDETGLLHVGSYRNSDEKDSILIIEKKGVKIAFLAYTIGSNYFTEEYFLKENPSITSILVGPNSKNFKEVKELVLSDFNKIKEMEDPPDLIAVLPHMGTQFSHDTDMYQDTWNDIFITAGADIILGDHSHAVQPIEFRNTLDDDGKEKTVLIVNSPGNFANSYVEHNGDATAIVEVYIDPQMKAIISAAVIPMYTQSPINGNYRALPIYNILNDDSVQSEISEYEMDRIDEVQDIVTSVMLGTKLTLDQAEDRYYFFPEGYFRQSVKPIEITDEMKETILFKLISESEKVCFIGDSITAGSKNGGYGWYEPMMVAFPDITVCRQAWGSATTLMLLENMDLIANQTADLYVIAIGTNDVRYRDKKICAMDSTSYVENIDSLISRIRKTNPNTKFVLIRPWYALDNDPYSAISIEERDYLLNEYGNALEAYSDKNGHLFNNPNPGIEERLSIEIVSNYLIDHIHPNANEGIMLYSQEILDYLGKN